MANKRTGRPSVYKPEFVEQAKKLCALGATDVELADFFKVSIRTIADWKVRHADFLHALKLGKETADERVATSLYQRAMGYTHDAVKIFMPANAREPVYAPYREHVPPDTTACIFWLKNRRPEEWRDQSNVKVTHDRTASGLTDEELQRIALASGNGAASSAQGAVKPDSLRKLN